MVAAYKRRQGRGRRHWQGCRPLVRHGFGLRFAASTAYRRGHRSRSTVTDLFSLTLVQVLKPILSNSNTFSRLPSSLTTIRTYNMAANQAQNLAGQLLKVSTAWPKDPFRPNLQLPVFFESLAKHPRLTPASVKASEALLNNRVSAKVSAFLLQHMLVLVC